MRSDAILYIMIIVFIVSSFLVPTEQKNTNLIYAVFMLQVIIHNRQCDKTEK